MRQYRLPVEWNEDGPRWLLFEEARWWPQTTRRRRRWMRAAALNLNLSFLL